MMIAMISLASVISCTPEIGSSCVLASDCSTTNDRICDLTQSGGYCTVIGCDADSCPEGSVCVQFFPHENQSRICNPDTEDETTDDCNRSETCSLNGYCVFRSSEIRYCMATCDSEDMCRSNYECRDRDLMREHGGQVLSSDSNQDPQAFCAEKPDNQ